MPLPEATLSFGPLIPPGGTEPVKPKVAMLVRLSSATIDALTSVMNEKEKVSVDLGSTPVRDLANLAIYDLILAGEETPHEIYLRVPRINSLKLYANVAEKLSIEHNEIGDDLKEKIRVSTLEAAKQRDSRKLKIIEVPPTQPPKKKRDVPRNTSRSSKQAKPSVSTSARVPSPAPPPSTKPSSASVSSTSGLLNRIVHCIVVGKRNRDAIVKLVSGDDPSIRRDIIELMDEVGEPASPLKKGEDVGSKIWCLKAQSWLHVRPLEWPGLNDKERLQLARTGRMKLSSLGYSEKDPEWRPFAYRSADTNVAAGKPTITVSQGDAREKPDPHAKSRKLLGEIKKPKTQSDSNAEIPVKDESLQTTRSSTTKTKEFTTSILAPKKVPGLKSGAGKSSAQDSSVAEGPRHGSEKGVKPVHHSLPSKTIAASQSTQKDRTTSSLTPAQRKKMQESDAGFGSESERDRDSRPKLAIKQEERRSAEVPRVKRTQKPRDSYDSDASTSLSAPQKKRKLDNGAVAASFTKDVRSTDFPLSKKLDIAPHRSKVHKESTPPPLTVPLPKINKKANGSSGRTTTSSGNAIKSSFLETTSSGHSLEGRGRSEGKVSGKRRRGSPIYTSSEDEGENTKIRRITPAADNHKTLHSRRREHERELRPLPTDHAGLRMRYTATYRQCMAALTTLLAQKARIDSMLRHADSGSVTDSDCDGELMDAEDLKKLSGDYERMHEELETIRRKFADPVQ
ncbi:hypothetical protein C0992_001916 [Termitomyces sp. T32_za158]|nr:hypothetical protein C0992_001916 [Termitomyces sp. T32_za158]